MRVPINIATRPPDSTRALRKGAMFLAALTTLLAIIAIRSELNSRNEFRSLVDRKSQLESQIRDLEASQKEMQSWLETPQVAQIRKRSSLLNSLISQKSLSWTRLFQDLETTLPAGVRITSIQPKTKDAESEKGQPELGLTVAAGSVGPIVEFIRRLEDSPEFASPAVASQRFPVSDEKDPEVKVSLSARYVQTLAPHQPQGTEGAADTNDAAEDSEPQAATKKPENLMAAGNGGHR